MDNEPVAWMQNHYETEKITKFSPVKVWENDIPLYTHPAEHDLGIAEAIGFEKGHNVATAKTLTDEEIRSVMALDKCWIGEDCSIPNMIEFARAILKRASEK
jgi:hypothetical protein